MGSNGSKSNNETSVSIVMQKTEADVCDNPDPRSPTPEVSRTPLHHKSGSKRNITKNVDLRKTFESTNEEEKLVHNNPILSAVIKSHLKSYDPRSPSQEFERTPIVLSSKTKERKLLQHQNGDCASPNLINELEENCDSCTEANESQELIMPKNLFEGFYDMSLNESIKEATGPLGSSTASDEALESNISANGFIEAKPVLLETNFDYVGTDQFDENQEKIQLKLEKLSGLDPRSPSIGIERTPIVLANPVDDIVEEMSDDSLIKVLQNSNAEFHQTMPHESKKEELLIYEDETTNINDTPKNSKSSYLGGSRTPLSCMKNKDAGYIRSKSANTLYDPKKGSKIPKRVSHIPRLKSLSKHSHMITNGSSVSLKNICKPSSVGGDCENTPPHSHRDRWDKDSSIVL